MTAGEGLSKCHKKAQTVEAFNSGEQKLILQVT